MGIYGEERMFPSHRPHLRPPLEAAAPLIDKWGYTERRECSPRIAPTFAPLERAIWREKTRYGERKRADAKRPKRGGKVVYVWRREKRSAFAGEPIGFCLFCGFELVMRFFADSNLSCATTSLQRSSCLFADSNLSCATTSLQRSSCLWMRYRLLPLHVRLDIWMERSADLVCFIIRRMAGTSDYEFYIIKILMMFPQVLS
ncbi:hypothetical protein QE152_g30962 [Popillia japonica]|uniref:Uncharacterized protein n=1 Tax=Popillia japonica TaxID=7064 RepID=A0AAW1JE55_POPJA